MMENPTFNFSMWVSKQNMHTVVLVMYNTLLIRADTIHDHWNVKTNTYVTVSQQRKMIFFSITRRLPIMYKTTTSLGNTD